MPIFSLQGEFTIDRTDDLNTLVSDLYLGNAVLPR
jgi:hypothetical protein